MDSLIRYVQQTGIAAEYLIVPGDVCNRANPIALQKAWADIESLRNALGASHAFATAGNHDYDSRYLGSAFDPKEALLALSPLFPAADQSVCDAYWASGIAEVTMSGIRFVLLNSSYFHGGVTSERTHGRFSPTMLRRLSNILNTPSACTKNILVCHHHPHLLSQFVASEQDRMLDGEKLLACLDDSKHDWLIIHGHRHIAHLVYSAGSAGSATVLAAGSATVRLSGELATQTRNQVHVITLEDTECSHSLRGIVRSIDFTPGVGWEAAGDFGGLPKECGFGFRGSTHSLAHRIRGAVEINQGPLPWERILAACPELRYLTPRDWVRTMDCASEIGVSMQPSGDGEWEAALQ